MFEKGYSPLPSDSVPVPPQDASGLREKYNVFRKTYRLLHDRENEYLDRLKDKAQELYDLIQFGNPLQSSPDSREKSLAKTKLEECIMWAVKDVTR